MKHSPAADPLKGNILKNMLLFALPIMGMTIMGMLFSSMDTLVISRFGHENAVSAIGVSSAFINMISGGLAAIGGVTIVLSNLYGQERHEEIKKLVDRLPLTGLILGGAAAALMFIFARPILGLLNCPDEIMADAMLYFRIYFMSMAVRLAWIICYAGPRGSIELIYVAYPICWALSTVLSIAAFEWDFHKIKKAAAKAAE